MLAIYPSKKRAILVCVVLSIIFITIAVFVAIRMTNPTYAASVIVVGTTVDEDETPGTGCSLYEATIAASTNAPYGGCTGGTGSGDEIQVSSGTYEWDPANATHRTLTLNNDSLTGIGPSAILDGYHIEMTGDAAAEMSSFTIMSYDDDTVFVYLTGSNKTFQTVDIQTGLFGATIIYLGADGSDHSGAVINDVTAGGGMQTSIMCVEGANCDNETISNVDLTGMMAATIECVGPGCGDRTGFHISNVSLEGGSSTNVNIEEDSSISDLTLTTTSNGGNAIAFGAGTTIDDVSQIHTGTGGGSLSLIGTAASVSNIYQSSAAANVTTIITAPTVENFEAEASGFGDVSFTNSYVGSVTTNIDITADSGYITFNSISAELSDITIHGNDGIVLYDQGNGLTVENVDIENLTSGGSGIYTEFSGDVVNVNDLVIVGMDGTSSLNFTGASIVIENLMLEQTSLISRDPGTVSIANFTSINSPSPALFVTGDFSDVNVSNVYIVGASRGIDIDSSNALPEQLEIKNVLVHDTISGSSYSAIVASEIDQSLLEGVTIINATQSGAGAISYYAGEHHIVKNVTIADSAGGIAVYAYDGDDMILDVYNTTIINNEDSSDHEDNSGLAAFELGASDSGVLTANIRNTVIGGTAPYVQCNVYGDYTVNTTKSYASHASCADEGFIADAAAADSFATSLDDNSSAQTNLGYNGENAKLPTLALISGGALVGAGDKASCLAYDARALQRNTTIGCDIGAFQFNTGAPTPDPDPGSEGDNGVGNSSGNNNSGSQLTNQPIAVTETEIGTETPSTTSPVLTTDKIDTDTDEDDQVVTEADNAGINPLFVLLGFGGIGLALLIIILIALRRRGNTS